MHIQKYTSSPYSSDFYISENTRRRALSFLTGIACSYLKVIFTCLKHSFVYVIGCNNYISIHDQNFTNVVIIEERKPYPGKNVGASHLSWRLSAFLVWILCLYLHILLYKYMYIGYLSLPFFLMNSFQMGLSYSILALSSWVIKRPATFFLCPLLTGLYMVLLTNKCLWITYESEKKPKIVTHRINYFLFIIRAL